MAKFDAGQTNIGEVQANNTIKEPFVKEPVGIQGLTNLFQQAGGLLKKDTERSKKRAVSQFRGDLLKIVGGVDQGRFKNPQAARSRMRALYIQYNENYPTIGAELSQAYSAVLGQTGMGNVLPEALRDQARKDALTDQLVANGYIGPNATEEEKEQAYSEFQTLEAANRKYTTVMQTLNLEAKKAANNSAKLASINERREQESRSFAYAMVAPITKQLSTEAANLRKQVQEGELSQAEAESIFSEIYNSGLEQYYSGTENGFSLSDLAKEDREQLEDLFGKRFELEMSRIRGDIEAGAVERQLKALENRTELMIRQSDKRVNRLLTISKIVDAASIELLANVGRVDLVNTVADMIYNGIEGVDDYSALPVFSGDPEALNLAFDVIGLNEGEGEQSDEQRLNILSNLISGAEDEESILRRNPKKGKALVKFLADNRFWTLRQQHPEAFENIAGAAEVIERHYADEIYGMVREEFLNANVQMRKDQEDIKPWEGPQSFDEVPATDQIFVEATPEGFIFKTDSEHRDIIKKTEQLNKDVAPILRRTVRATAHLNGHKNYQQEAEKALGGIFGGEGDAELPGGDAGDDLSLDSFLNNTGALDRAMSDGGFVGDGDFEGADSPEEVAARFVGFTESEHTDILSSFFRKTFGASLDPNETAWCAAFVNAALGATGKSGTGDLVARSFLKWGEEVSSPQKGDIAVFSRGNSSWKGHVGFYVGPSERDGYVKILGGNQDNRVSIKDYPEEKLLGYRRG